MSDISQVQLGSRLYNIKDQSARSGLNNKIDKNTNDDVNAIVNFVNGLKVGGKSVVSQATADVVVIPADDEPGVDLTIDQQGVAHFSFRIPINSISLTDSIIFFPKLLTASKNADIFSFGAFTKSASLADLMKFLKKFVILSKTLGPKFLLIPFVSPSMMFLPISKNTVEGD